MCAPFSAGHNHSRGDSRTSSRTFPEEEKNMPNDPADPHVLQPRTEQTAVIATEGAASPEAVEKIETALRLLPGVIEVEADTANERVTVKFDPQKTDVPALHECIERSGYKSAAVSDEDRLGAGEKL
jgi:copper chaperone CopZ